MGFDPAILDITEDDIRGRFLSGVQNVAAVSLAIGYPTVASVPHSIANGFKNIMAVAAATDIEFEQVAQMKAFLADPSAFAVAAPVAGGAVEEKQEEAAPPNRRRNPTKTWALVFLTKIKSDHANGAM